MMKKIRNLLILCGLTAACTLPSAAQSWVGGTEFEFLFDNREYGGCASAVSKTVFGIGLTPEAGLEWAGRNRLMIGLSASYEFGSRTPLADALEALCYYRYAAPRVQVTAGLFPRSQMRGSYSEAFFDSEVLFYHSRMQGLLARWQEGGSYAEFVIDWEGLRTRTQRERFRILSEGRWTGRHWFGGYSFMLLHYARMLDAPDDQGVVDQLLVNPHGGVRFHAGLDFEIRIGWLQSLQRDRIARNGWKSPKGAEFDVRLSRWGFALDNRLYAGQNLMPFYGTYGPELYACSAFYGSGNPVYNRTALSYERSFFDDTLAVSAAFVVHCDGTGVGLQQLLKLNVRLEKISLPRKK